jgi:anti-sigma B factor antagonist
MQLRWSEQHKVAVIDPQGDLGLRTIVDVKNGIGGLLRDGCRTLILDCTGVNRLEAMSLGVLVERLCRARDVGGTLALANLSPEVVNRLQELRVHTLFPIFDSVQAALDGLVGLRAEAAATLAA